MLSGRPFNQGTEYEHDTLKEPVLLWMQPLMAMTALSQLLCCRQARQNFGTGASGGGMGAMGFGQPSPSGLQLAGQLSPLQESSFTPHRTQPKNNLRQLLDNTGEHAQQAFSKDSCCTCSQGTSAQ